jgi:hypothetical protein
LRQGTAVFVIEAERFGTLARAKPPELPERQRCTLQCDSLISYICTRYKISPSAEPPKGKLLHTIGL